MSEKHRKPMEKRERPRKKVGVEIQIGDIEGYTLFQHFWAFMWQAIVVLCSGPKNQDPVCWDIIHGICWWLCQCV